MADSQVNQDVMQFIIKIGEVVGCQFEIWFFWIRFDGVSETPGKSVVFVQQFAIKITTLEVTAAFLSEPGAKAQQEERPTLQQQITRQVFLLIRSKEINICGLSVNVLHEADAASDSNKCCNNPYIQECSMSVAAINCLIHITYNIKQAAVQFNGIQVASKCLIRPQ